MSTSVPSYMHALVLTKYCKPSKYYVATVSIPKISKPDELLVKVLAASVNPLDVKLAVGMGKYMEKSTFPYKIGYDLAGIVVSVGTAVSNLKLGDEVYSRSLIRGSIAQYAITTESATALKPKSLSFSEAASIPLAAQSALQSLRRGDNQISGGLKGKTVFIPAGLSGTGSFGVQLAKNVFGAGKVITTLSTGKLSKIMELLGDSMPDQIIDYTKESIVHAVGKGSVDYMFDTVGGTLSAIPLMKKDGVIVSISTISSGKEAQQIWPHIGYILGLALNGVDWFFRTRTGWSGINYSFLFDNSNTADLEALARWVDEGKIKPIVGTRVRLSDIEGVRKGCQQILDGKGGIGKLVIDID